MKTLEQYFQENWDRQIIDHSVRVQRQADGTITFIIHPAQVSGDTLDFIVKESRLLPAGWAHGCEEPENVINLADALKV